MVPRLIVVVPRKVGQIRRPSRRHGGDIESLPTAAAPPRIGSMSQSDRRDIATPPSAWRYGASTVLVRRIQQNRNDTAMIVVVPRQRLEIADLRGDTAEILNMHKTAAAPPRIGPLAKSAEGSPWRRRMIRRLSWGSFTCNVVMVVLSWKHKKYESVSVELTGSFGKFVNIRDMWRCHWYPMAVLLRCSCGNEVSTEVRARRYCSLQPHFVL